MSLILSGTDGLSDVDGTAATPAIRGTDTNTGIFFPAADTIAFSEGGTEAMRIDSSGNVGIGTTSPAYRFQSVNTAGNSFISAVSSNSTTAGILLGDTDSATVGRVEYNNADNAMLLFTSGSERMRITSSGNVLVGTTDSSLTTGVGYKYLADANNPYIGIVNNASSNANNNYHLFSAGTGTYRFYVGLGGTVFATNTTISAISDVRLKENIQDIDVGLDAVMALKPRKFDWKAGKGKDIKGDRGWIAQEFETVFPEMINEWLDPSPEGEEPYKSVSADLIPVLVKAIQELKATVDAQAARITALEAAP